MIVEINLLEEKEKRNIVPFLIGLVGIFLLLITFVTVSVQQQALKEQQQSIQQELQRIKKEQASYQAILQDETQAARHNLQETVGQVNQAIFPSVPLLERMIALLPDRGYFERYTYTEENNLELIVRFDSLQEVAAYTSELLQKEYIDQVELNNITTEQLSEQFDPLEYRPRYIAEYQLDIHRERWMEEVEQNES